MATEPRSADRKVTGGQTKLCDILLARGAIQANILSAAEEAGDGPHRAGPAEDVG